MIYVFEATSACAHRAVPLNVGGNALDVNSLKMTCSVCGTPANVNSAQAVDLDPKDPGFENRLEELTAEFSTLTFYLATVENGQLRLEVRPRKQITIGFAVYCKTCKKSLPIDDRIKEVVNGEHGDHDVLIGPVSDTPLSPKLQTMFNEAMERLFGEKLPFREK